MMVLDYELNLTVSPGWILTFGMSGGYKVTIAKVVSTSLGYEDPSVRWLVFFPSVENKVKWKKRFHMCANHEHIWKNGAPIRCHNFSYFPLFADGELVTLDYWGKFHRNLDVCPKGSIGIINELDRGFDSSFGLLQEAALHQYNGDHRFFNLININNFPVYYPEQFIPKTTVYIWVQRSFPANTFIRDISGKVTIVEFVGENRKANLEFDDWRFVDIGTKGDQLSLEKGPIVRFR